MTRPDTSWMSQGLCHGKTALFFPGAAGVDSDYTPAKQICAECPVSAPCRAYAMQAVASGVQLHGCWGGMDEVERVNLIGRIKPPRKQPEHGTANGYKQHRRLGEEACQGCIEANRKMKAYNAASRVAS